VKVGLMADSHDNLPMIRRALEEFEKREVKYILHAGDFIAPFAVKEIQKFNGSIAAVFGNNDGEKNGILKLGLDVKEGMRVVELQGRRILLSHLHPQDTAEVDMVVYGHTHEVDVERGEPLVVNPGECGGWLTGKPTVAVVELDNLEVEIVALRD